MGKRQLVCIHVWSVPRNILKWKRNNKYMKRCLVIINKQSGRAKNIKKEEIERYIGSNYALDFDYLERETNYDNYETVAVCGGDGTLSTILNQLQNKKINLLYFPFGTVNDRARTDVTKNNAIIGSFNEKTFSYVAACGTFTAIGYITDIRKKKRYRMLAYLFEAIKEFKIQRITAEIKCDGKLYNGTYTLIMLIKSKCCFYFPFNKLYDKNSLTAHLLLIKSPNRLGLIGYIQLFIRFFKVFFLGMRRIIEDKNITFIPFEKLDITLNEQCDFCIDGERYTSEKHISVGLKRTEAILEIVPAKILKAKKSNDY